MKKLHLTKYIKISLLASTLMLIPSCSDRNLEDVQNLGSFDTNNYYSNEEECYTGLVATYDLMRKYAGGFENMVSFFNAGSDDCYAGGGNSSDGAGIQGLSNYTINPTTIPESYFNDFYKGIARANILINKVPAAEMDESTKSRFIAEAKVLRSLYYFELARMFGNIPLITEPIETDDDYYNIPQSTATEVYAQIESDILESIDSLPTTVSGEELGRMTQGSAKALLGKIYLYDGKNDLAAAQFADVNGTPGGTSQYGYKLVSNFSDLWNPDNKFTTESIIEAVYTNKSLADWANWGGDDDEGNSLCIMVGPRSYNWISSPAPQIVSGWSFNPVTTSLFDFMSGDPRFDDTVLNAKKLVEDGNITYTAGYMDTGYFLNKFQPLKDYATTLTGATEINFRQDYMVIRLADTYLMEAEALGGTGARAQALLDAVRARVGLASTPVSMTAIKNERRRELAGEGHRWFDLVRWGDAPSVLGSRGFVSGKNEILPIPKEALVSTALVQNPNY